MLFLFLLPLALLGQPDETSRLLHTGAHLTEAGAAKLEKALSSKPDDLKRHVTLLGYYHAAERNAVKGPGPEEARLNHLVWLVANRPNSDALHSDAALPHNVESPYTSPPYQRIRTLWLEQVKRNPKSIEVHLNAVRFFALPDRQTARSILQDAARLAPNSRAVQFMLGLLDGLTVLDVSAINHNGLIDPNLIPHRPSQTATAMLKSLESSDDPLQVCGSGVAVVRYGSVLLGAPSSDRDILLIAASLLNRALQLDPRSPECREYGLRVNAWQSIKNSGWSIGDQQGRRILVDGALSQTWKMSDVPPVYPARARANGLQGTVTIIAVIGVDGVARRAEAVSGPDELRPAALESFRHWEYEPLINGGKPAEYLTDVQFHFKLSR